jgi:hypothetical protein
LHLVGSFRNYSTMHGFMNVMVLSPSSCMSVPVITTEPLCQLNLSCYECAVIAGHPLRQTHNSLPTTLPTWLPRFIGDIRFQYFDVDKLTKCSISYVGFSFPQLFKLWMTLKLAVHVNSHPFMQLMRYLDAVWKRAICTLWPLQPRSLNSWYSLDRGLGEPKKLSDCYIDKCYVVMSKI